MAIPADPSQDGPRPAALHASDPHRSESRLLVWLALRLKGLGEVASVAEVHALDGELTERLLGELCEQGHCQYREVGGEPKYLLTPSGRSDGEAALAAELDAAGARPAVAAAYRDFLALNPKMLQLCTDWQVLPEGHPSVANGIDASEPSDKATSTFEPSGGAAGASEQGDVGRVRDQGGRTLSNPSGGAAQGDGGRLNDHSDRDYDAAILDRLEALHAEMAEVLAALSAALARYGSYAPRFAEALRRLCAGELDYLTKPMIPSYHTVWLELHEDLLATQGINRADEASA